MCKFFRIYVYITNYWLIFFFSSRRRHTRCALVTGVQTCALPVVNAHYRLNRLQWLRDNGITFGFDFETEIAKLRTIAADWEPRFAGQAARRQVGEAYTIETDTEPAALADLPLGEILSPAAEVEGRDFYEIGRPHV